jgi:lysozyme family protein
MTSREIFERAIVVVLEHEGGYIDHPADHGGPTNFGISERWNPGVDVASLTREDAVEIYWTTRWDGRGYDQLPERTAIKTFDLAVNLGEKTAVTILQRALRSVRFRVAIDGILGPETAGAVSRVCELALLAAIRSEAAGEYRIRLVRDDSQAVFAEGWMERAYS